MSRAEHGHDGHDHQHGPGGHAHVPASFGMAFAVGLALNAGYVLVEAVAGLAGHSTALLADAGHNLGDVLGLAVAWLATGLAKRRPTRRFTYGLGGSTILAALFNAVVLLLIVGALGLEAVQKLLAPEPVAGGTVMAVAAAGVVVNGATAWLFASGRKHDLNRRAAFAHMASDALVGIGVVAAGAAILLTGKPWIDPLVSLAVNAAILAGTWGLLRDSLSMAMQAIPPGIDADRVQAFLLGRPGVARLHDLHIWPMSTTDHAMTAHLVMPDGHPGDEVLAGMAESLRERFDIGHATLQIETSVDGPCHLACDARV